MDLHNQARAQVGVAPLQWDPELARHAQKWADQLALQGGRLSHSDADEGEGESLALYLPANGERPVHGAMLWYSERGRYHGEVFTDSICQTCGHYTQMVWKNSTKVGFGISLAPNGNAILVARYREAGNMMGETAY